MGAFTTEAPQAAALDRAQSLYRMDGAWPQRVSRMFGRRVLRGVAQQEREDHAKSQPWWPEDVQPWSQVPRFGALSDLLERQSIRPRKAQATSRN